MGSNEIKIYLPFGKGNGSQETQAENVCICLSRLAEPGRSYNALSRYLFSRLFGTCNMTYCIVGINQSGRS